MSNSGKIKSQVNTLAFGESLFDFFPNTKRLGGAPLNFAIYASRLGAKVSLVTAVGKDELGLEIEQMLLNENVNCDYLQWHPVKSTGKVMVNFQDDREPIYEIIEDVAWDYLDFSSQLATNLSNYNCLYFGTLAQRNSITRDTLRQYLQLFEGFKFVDLNLRNPYYNQHLILESIKFADGLKLNLAEAEYLQTIYNFDPNLQNWLDKYNLQWIVLTQGAKGTKWIDKTQIIELNPVASNPRKNADSVGAGDAVAAVTIVGYLQGLSPREIIQQANQLGAYVASFPGALTPYPK